MQYSGESDSDDDEESDDLNKTTEGGPNATENQGKSSSPIEIPDHSPGNSPQKTPRKTPSKVQATSKGKSPNTSPSRNLEKVVCGGPPKKGTNTKSSSKGGSKRAAADREELRQTAALEDMVRVVKGAVASSKVAKVEAPPREITPTEQWLGVMHDRMKRMDADVSNT